MTTVKPTIGRIVHYTLSQTDAEQINRRREDAERERRGRRPDGAQIHFGNRAVAGEVYPMLIVRVWGLDLDAQAATEERLVNGQVFLDGNDTLWVTSVAEGEGERRWVYPPRV